MEPKRTPQPVIRRSMDGLGPVRKPVAKPVRPVRPAVAKAKPQPVDQRPAPAPTALPLGRSTEPRPQPRPKPAERPEPPADNQPIDEIQDAFHYPDIEERVFEQPVHRKRKGLVVAKIFGLLLGLAIVGAGAAYLYLTYYQAS